MKNGKSFDVSCVASRLKPRRQSSRNASRVERVRCRWCRLTRIERDGSRSRRRRRYAPSKYAKPTMKFGFDFVAIARVDRPTRAEALIVAAGE